MENSKKNEKLTRFTCKNYLKSNTENDIIFFLNLPEHVKVSQPLHLVKGKNKNHQNMHN